jgi:ABC-2 type transport system ATP-binding protein
MQSETPAALIVELVKFVELHGLMLMDISMKRPTLEDVFIELTGKKLRE